MTYPPNTLLELGRYWTDHGGINLGIVGDAAHTRGYHLGRDRIYSPSGVGDQDYSVNLARDKRGLSNGAAAIDLGRLRGSLPNLYAFSRALVDLCQSGSEGTQDIREIIYSPDGKRVQRYSHVDGLIHSGPGNGDASHIGHTHVSYYRDSEARRKIAPFAQLLEGDMAAIVWYPTGGGDGTVTLKEGRGLVDLITGRRYVPDDREKASHAEIHADGVGDGYLVRDQGHGCLALKDACVFTPAQSPDPGIRERVTVEGSGITVTQEPIP